MNNETLFFFNLVFFFNFILKLFLTIIRVAFELVKSAGSYRDNSHVL
jgi:hypothetical protein